MENKIISISKLTMLWRCGEQYYRRYIKGEIIPPGVAIIVGSSTHKTIEVNLKNKIEKKQLLNLDIIKDLARDEVTKRFEGEILLSEEEKSKGKEAVKGEAIDFAVSCSEAHAKELAPKIEPIAIEKTFYLDIPNNPFQISGTIDILEENKIRDTKTTSRFVKGTADKSLQLTMYSLAEKITENKKIKKLCLDFLVKRKDGTEVITEETKRDDKDFEVLLARIENALNQLKAGIFPPTNPENWWCSEKFCGYYKTCKYVKK